MSARVLTSGRLLRRGRSALRGGLAMVFVFTVIAAAVITSGPRIASGVLAAELSYRLHGASASILDLQSSVDPISTTASDFTTATKTTWDAFDGTMPLIRNSMTTSLKSSTLPGRYVGRNDGSTHAGIPASGAPHTPPKHFVDLSLEGNPGLRSDAILTSGEWPTKAVDDPAVPIPVVVTEATATELDWNVGETQTLGGAFDEPREIVLVGTVRPRHPTADYWQLDATRAKASGIPSTDGDSITYHGVVWLDADSWAGVALGFDGAAIRSWFPVDVSRITPDSLADMQAGLAQFTSSARTVGNGVNAVHPRYSSSFSLVADDYNGRAPAASGVISVIDAGPLGTGGALLLLAVSLLVDRRRSATRLQRARGASNGQLRAELAGQLAVATVPGAALGVILGALVSPGGLSPGLLIIAAVVAVVPIAFGAIQLAPPVIDRLGANALGRARLVFDGVLLILAALDVLLLVQRGLGGQALGVGADPLLTATPLVLSAAGCALALRLLPPALRALGSIVRRGRGATALIGRANSARVGARFLPVFATMTGIAIALFASSILATQQQGLHDAGVGLLGADIRISGTPVSDAAVEKLRDLPGVADLAVVKSLAGVRAGGHSEDFAVVVVDAKQLNAVEADLSPQKRRFPLLGTERGGHPVAYGGGFLKTLGTRATLQDGLPLTVSTIEDDDPAPKFVANSPWVLLDESALPAAQREQAEPESVLIRVTPGSDADRVVRDIKKTVGSGPLITSALKQVRDLTASPLVAGLTTIALLAIGLSMLFSVLALLLALLMNAAARAALLARLRALGFARRQAIGLIGWELGPMVVLGAIAGAALGILIALLFLAVVDLSAFVGGDSPPVAALDPVLALGSVGVFVVVATLATLVTAVAATSPLSSARRTRELDPS